MYKTENEYYRAIASENYKKPTVLCSYIYFIDVGFSGRVKTINHPAEYLNDEPYVKTSKIISISKDGKSFETLYTHYVLSE